MPEHVLVAVDDSEQAEAAADHAFTEYPAATMSLLHVVDPVEAGYGAGTGALPGYSEEWYERSVERAESLLDGFADRAAEAGVTGSVRTATEVGRPARTIVEYAEAEGVDHIVIGSHGRSGVTRVLLGSVAETVVRRSPVPVTVVR